MIIYPLTYSSASFDLLEGSVYVVLSLVLLLMITDAVIDLKSRHKQP